MTNVEAITALETAGAEKRRQRGLWSDVPSAEGTDWRCGPVRHHRYHHTTIWQLRGRSGYDPRVQERCRTRTPITGSGQINWAGTTGPVSYRVCGCR
jgi:hypothetical protein